MNAVYSEILFTDNCRDYPGIMRFDDTGSIRRDCVVIERVGGSRLSVILNDDDIVSLVALAVPIMCRPVVDEIYRIVAQARARG